MMTVSLPLAQVLAWMAITVAREEFERSVVELRPNWHPRILDYWLNGDPPLDIRSLAKKPPWCAIFIQFVTDEACRRLQISNPLDAVKREAYVDDYYQWAIERGVVVPRGERALPGDLGVFSFSNPRFDHIGLVVGDLPDSGLVKLIEGNTGDQNQREGDGVHMKVRDLTFNKATLLRWVNAS